MHAVFHCEHHAALAETSQSNRLVLQQPATHEEAGWRAATRLRIAHYRRAQDAHATNCGSALRQTLPAARLLQICCRISTIR
jgi:hypothetical protein